MNHITRTTEIYSGRKGCTRNPKFHVSVGTEYCHAGSISHSTNRRLHAPGPQQVRGGAFPPPGGSCSPEISLPPSPGISQPQSTNPRVKASSASGRGGHGGGRRQGGRGPGGTHGVDLDSVVLPAAQAHSAEPRSAAAPTAGLPPSPRGCATYGPRAPPGPVTIPFIQAGRAPPFPLAVFQSQCREGGVPSLGRASVKLGMSGHHNPLSFRLCRSNTHITPIF